MGNLYLVSTPIGNLEDISARALRVLGEVSLIAAEDTRRTRNLLAHYKIRSPVTSYFDHNKHYKIDHVLKALDQGDVALVSDSGTPVINDPGHDLVIAAIQAGHTVSPIPGPCAPIAALSASGLPSDSFLYLGYLPRRQAERRRLLDEIDRIKYTLIFLEAPHRLIASLEDIHAVLGNRDVCVARELTKMHEEIYHGKIGGAIEHFTSQAPRGEFTLVIGAASDLDEIWTEEALRDVLADSLDSGRSASQIAQQVSKESGWPRREIYTMLAEIDSQRRGSSTG